MALSSLVVALYILTVGSLFREGRHGGLQLSKAYKRVRRELLLITFLFLMVAVYSASLFKIVYNYDPDNPWSMITPFLGVRSHALPSTSLN